MSFILYIVLGLIFISLVFLSYHFSSMVQKLKNEEEDISNIDVEEKIENIHLLQGYNYSLLVLIVIAAITVLYFQLKGTIYEGHVMEWLNLVVRLMHITFGIAWIGASFYFVFLENALNRTNNVRDELAGNLWAVHGGGFYYLEKYKVAPTKIPKDLHWFKYEAYFTWLTGFSLLFIVYYFNADAFLIDKNIWNTSGFIASLAGIFSFAIAWIIYDVLCKSKLSNNNTIFAIVGIIIIAGFAYGYSHLFSSRAAFIHFGAMLGSLMAANVFFVIIPFQKEMVVAAKKGVPLDASLGKKALFRSIHNNYFTLPVLFVMISNHFPSTFSQSNSWLILLILTVGTAGVKHYLNLKEKQQQSYWILPVSALILLSAAYLSSPKPISTECKNEISISEVNKIITARCIKCHATKPTEPSLASAPNGIIFESPQDIVKLKDKILQRVVITKTMPQNNVTNMTDDERNIVRCWIQQGASLK